MQKLLVLCLLALSATTLTAVSDAAARSGPEVLRQGGCTGSTTWKLKLKHDNGRIEAEFEIDQNLLGKRWSVVGIRNGVVVFRGTRTTRAPSGSFEARKLFANAAGADRVVARGRALGSGEVCRGSASI